MTCDDPHDPRDRGRVGRVHRRGPRPVGHRPRGRHRRRRTGSSTCSSTTFMADPFATIGDGLRLARPRAHRRHASSGCATSSPTTGRTSTARTRYSWADTGLDEGEWRERTRRYQDHFGVLVRAACRDLTRRGRNRHRAGIGPDEQSPPGPRTELAAAIRAGELIEPRAARAVRSTASSGSNAAINAVVTLDARPRPRRGRPGRRRGGPRRVARAAARAPDHDQGRDRGRRASGPPAARSSSPTTCPPRTRRRSRGSRTRARSCSARPTCRAGPATCRPTTSSSGPRTTRGTSTACPAGRRAARRPRSPPGFTAFELGTDIGGSIRIPSHCCGVFGLKPSYGVVSQRGYLDHVGGGTTDADINVFGPIARSAEDLDLLLGVLAGPDADRRASPGGSSCPRRAEADALRAPGRRLVRARRACRSTATSSRSCAAPRTRSPTPGAKVEDAHPPVDFAEQVRPVRPADRVGGLARASTTAIAEAAERLAPRLAAATTSSGRGSARVWAEWFEDYDALLCPVLPVPAFPHDQEGDILSRTVDRSTARSTRTCSLTAGPGSSASSGCPSAVPPIGRTAGRACRSASRS